MGSDFGMLLCGCWLPLLFSTLILVGVGRPIAHALKMRGLTDGEIHCGHCKYPTRGIGSWRCPECGKDLHEIGLLSRHAPRHKPAEPRILLWTLLGSLLIVVGDFLSAWARRVVR